MKKTIIMICLTAFTFLMISNATSIQVLKNTNVEDGVCENKKIVSNERPLGLFFTKTTFHCFYDNVVQNGKQGMLEKDATDAKCRYYFYYYDQSISRWKPISLLSYLIPSHADSNGDITLHLFRFVNYKIEITTTIGGPSWTKLFYSPNDEIVQCPLI